MCKRLVGWRRPIGEDKEGTESLTRVPTSSTSSFDNTSQSDFESSICRAHGGQQYNELSTMLVLPAIAAMTSPAWPHESSIAKWFS